MQTVSPPSRGGERKGKVISFFREVWCEASFWRCWCFFCFWDPVRALLAKRLGQVCVCVCVCVGMSEVIARACGILYFLKLFWLLGLWVLSSPTSHWTWLLAVRTLNPNHWATRGFLKLVDFSMLNKMGGDIHPLWRCRGQSEEPPVRRDGGDKPEN